jgi:hypothetical protein
MRDNIHILILPTLIMTTPFLVFLNYNSYCFTCAETLIVFNGCVLVALICSGLMLLGGWRVRGVVMAVLIMFFIDLAFTPWDLVGWVVILLFAGMQTFVFCLFLKEKFYTVTTTIFLAFFAVTILQLSFSANKTDSLFDHHATGIRSPPRIIHLILDEHLGIEGIPRDVTGSTATKNFLVQFYIKNGFQLFGGAHSRYYNTHLSIGNMLNFTSDAEPTALMGGRGPYTLLRNEYFKLLSNKLYRIEVLSPGWVDFCSSSAVVVSACVGKNWSVLRNFAKVNSPVSQKVQVLSSRYLNYSSVVAGFIHLVALPSQTRFPALAGSILDWIWAFLPERGRTDSLNTLADLKLLWNNILSLPHGTVLFAHLLIPHYPYVALADCTIRPTNRDYLWNFSGLVKPSMTRSASRAEHYQQYLEQLQCLYLKLDDLFDQMRTAGIYDDSIIVLHGDHGSRIVMTEPTAENQHALTKQDLVDGFSTLFAMKFPGKPGGYDRSPFGLEQLLAKFAFEAGLTPANRLDEKSDPYVYLTADGDKKFVRVPYSPPPSQ